MSRGFAVPPRDVVDAPFRDHFRCPGRSGILDFRARVLGYGLPVSVFDITVLPLYLCRLVVEVFEVDFPKDSAPLVLGHLRDIHAYLSPIAECLSPCQAACDWPCLGARLLVLQKPGLEEKIPT